MSMATITQSPEVTQSLCLRSGNSISNEFYSNCFNCCNNYANDKTEEEKASAPMPWIGLYVAAASLICTLAMAADLFHGFRNKKLWFPCKFFTLNATTLTLLAIAMKLPVDLTTSMQDELDQITKICSSVFICTVMSNFMPSLGQMSNKEIFINVSALGILVVTVIVNLCIQLEVIGLPSYLSLTILTMPAMLLVFLMTISSALYVPSAKTYIELKYHEMHKPTPTEESNIIRKFDVDQLKEDVKKYWVMAQTSSPQFMMARSVTCVASGAICVVMALVLIIFRLPYFIDASITDSFTSSYRWSIPIIIVVQSIGVVVGTIACAVRLFAAVILKCSGIRAKTFKTEFKTANYWIESLVEWKEKPLPLNIRGQKSKRLRHNLKNLVLCFCIRVQIMVVVVSKLIIFLFLIITAPIMFCWFCWQCCKWLKRKFTDKSAASNHLSGSESASGRKMDLSSYILGLENENELPKRILMKIVNEVDHLIQMGKKKKLENLKRILKKSTNFNGVAKFDSEKTPTLVSNELHNSWMMTVVTLTSIAVALPNVEHEMVEVLLQGINEGLLYMGLVEKDLDGKGYLVNITDAAEVTWLDVESRKWLDQDLRTMASKEKNSNGTLKTLADIAKNIILESKKKANKIQKEKWPVKVIVANSMYKITQALLLDNELNNQKTDAEVFDKLSVMISDILAACLTNLPRVITMKCFCSLAEKREESVQQAGQLLGETEEILKILQQHELPKLNQDQAAYIDEWRRIIKQDHILGSISASNRENDSDDVGEIRIAIEQEAS